MKKVGFITNTDKDPRFEYTAKLVNFVLEKGCQAYLTEGAVKYTGAGTAFSGVEEIYEQSDFVVVLGGDGTILRVARKTALYNTPILGINFGTLGYLADVEKSDAMTAIDAVLNEKYRIEKRMMIEASIVRKDTAQDRNIALNEVCINSSGFTRLISLGIEVNGQYIDTFRADGVIVSTPTGSTAYNLSAGGPILNPATELMTITHICPHALYARPIVFSGNDVLKIKIESSYNNIQMTLDGKQSIQLKNDDVVKIKKSKYTTGIIKTTDTNFYDILRRKMVEVRI